MHTSEVNKSVKCSRSSKASNDTSDNGANFLGYLVRWLEYLT